MPPKIPLGPTTGIDGALQPFSQTAQARPWLVSLCNKDGGRSAGLIGGEAQVGDESHSCLLHEGDELFRLPLVGRLLDRHPL
ncbi:MAG: hypothetical protein K2X52_25540 [Mycobacteriaceae bacterium]|jgi:hypothetical protein|nr:hypothetical protein [Mycobacteriaceae bacterium]